MTQVKVTSDYIAKPEEEFNAQGENILAKLLVHQATLGLSDEQVASITASIQNDKALSEKKNITQAQSRSTTKEYDTNHPICVKVLRDLRKELLNNPNCTPAILEDFGLNPSHRVIDTDTQQPIIHVELVSGVPQIKFKKSVFDGIRLFCNMNSGDQESEYEETITHHVWKDKKPRLDPLKPETRSYYAYYLYKTQIVGQKSNVDSITLEALK
ncbi:hypothetical protein GCQ56_19055 [Marinifilum sp. N1E240]|uniref:hypothetical protein n=1 Tax=Marinifilum sp. N1E240 TaxID=2608082 RepID=UPI00128BA1AF|nr:hypothetical protein [Marinifilum sp. N1E240]MPQ49103.1 hypothetical protein [Marinifilum sp. N1E240]